MYAYDQKTLLHTICVMIADYVCRLMYMYTTDIACKTVQDH